VTKKDEATSGWINPRVPGRNVEETRSAKDIQADLDKLDSPKYPMVVAKWIVDTFGDEVVDQDEVQSMIDMERSDLEYELSIAMESEAAQ
jgi:hypothetical protein